MRVALVTFVVPKKRIQFKVLSLAVQSNAQSLLIQTRVPFNGSKYGPLLFRQQIHMMPTYG